MACPPRLRPAKWPPRLPRCDADRLLSGRGDQQGNRLIAFIAAAKGRGAPSSCNTMHACYAGEVQYFLRRSMTSSSCTATLIVSIWLVLRVHEDKFDLNSFGNIWIKLLHKRQ
jgi:hypothetical protein